MAPQPLDRPVVDDHVSNIIVRGYGTADQAADVFATLLAYEGVPATLEFTDRSRYAFALAFIGGEWRVFDVREGRAFRTPSGALATLAQLRSDPGLTAGLPHPRETTQEYPDLLRSLEVPTHLRPYDQMPLLRLRYEVDRLLPIFC